MFSLVGPSCDFLAFVVDVGYILPVCLPVQKYLLHTCKSIVISLPKDEA